MPAWPWVSPTSLWLIDYGMELGLEIWSSNKDKANYKHQDENVENYLSKFI